MSRDVIFRSDDRIFTILPIDHSCPIWMLLDCRQATELYYFFVESRMPMP